MVNYNTQPDTGRPSMVTSDLHSKIRDAGLRPHGQTISPDFAKSLAGRAGDINVLRQAPPTKDVGLTL